MTVRLLHSSILYSINLLGEAGNLPRARLAEYEPSVSSRYPRTVSADVDNRQAEKELTARVQSDALRCND